VSNTVALASTAAAVARVNWRIVCRPRVAWLAFPGLLYLAMFFIYPVVQLLLTSLQDPESGAFSLAAYRRLMSATVYLDVMRTTFFIAAETAALCLLLGYPLAYWLARMPAGRRAKLILLVMLPFWTSALVKSFSWLVLLARHGIVANTIRALNPSGQAPELLHGRGPVLMAMIHTLLPLAVLTMLPVMLQIDRTLPRAAATLGSSAAQAFWRVFFHLSVPGVTASGLLVFIAALGFFIVPALLGGPHETMIGQVILDEIQQAMDWQFGGALAALLMVATLTSSFLFDRLFGVSAGPASGRARSSPHWLRMGGMALLAVVAGVSEIVTEGLARVLGGHRFGWLLPAYAVALVGFLMVPTLMVLPMSFTNSRFLDFPPTGFSLHWMQVYFGSPQWVAATLRSFGVAFATSLVTTVIAGAAAMAVTRSRGLWARLVFTLFLGPMIVPSIVTAVALFYLFAHLRLVATDLGLVIGHTVMALPIAFVALVAVLNGHDWRLDQAAATLGAGRLAVLRHVTVPLIRGGLLAALLFAFIISFEELTVALFVSGGLKTTLPKQMWDDVLLAVNPTLAAASLIVVSVVTTLFIIAERMRPRGG
jgi:putative spermidine/putrescine transport system permease protein